MQEVLAVIVGSCQGHLSRSHELVVARRSRHVVEEGLMGPWPPAIVVLTEPHARSIVVYELVLFHEGIVVNLQFDSLRRLLITTLLKLSKFAAI